MTSAADFGLKFIPASVQLLEQRLVHADPGVRNPAATGIHKLEAPEEPLVECLERLIQHENWFVQQAVVLAAGATAEDGKGIAITSRLAPFLEHEDAAIRRHASWAMLNIIDHAKSIAATQVVAEKVATTGEAPEPIPPCPTAAQLLCAPHHACKSAADELLARFNPKNTEKYPDAMEMLNSSQASAVLAGKEMAACFNSEDRLVRQNAVKALGKMEQIAAPHAVALGKLIVDPSVSVRNEVIRTIRLLGGIVTESAGVIGEGLAHADSAIRHAAKRALLTLSVEAGPASAAGAAAQLESEDPVTRLAAADCLAELGPLACPHGPELACRLEDQDVAIRSTAVHALICGGHDMEPHMKVIKKRTLHPTPEVQRAAVAALRGLACVCPKIARGADLELQETTEVVPRKMALEVLAGAAANVEPYLPDIVLCLEDSDWAINRAAIETLCDLKEHAEGAAMEVARRLTHHDHRPRRCAAEALGRMGKHAGDYGHRVEALRDTEEDEDVKRTAEEACEMLYAAGMAHDA